MRLSPVAIALQGLGFGPQAVALHGFVPVGEVVPEPQPEPKRPVFSTGGGRGGGPDAQVSLSDFVRRFVRPSQLPKQRTQPASKQTRQKKDAELLQILLCY